ncbi:tRNA(adenine(34)) deaminase, chloroplastic-like [Canna indica]|uniref:tRNA(Adenine(34)) deaminase, chloroplastic-like n=1 Tax=Canna indica TaxID=4628 RepID=A0AAQ3KC41_9LILI|nr:tRNA(adenine(34)) deaminase, chloroplastic-like [Canna indica]
MYCGYSTATIALREKPSLCHSRRLAILDNGGGDDFPLRGLSINPRFLLYGYYLRQSSLIYWSPLRSFLAGHDGHSYSRMSLLDDEPYSAGVPARRGGSRDCYCCCCCSSQRSFRRDPYRENYGDRIWEDEADSDEFDRSRRYPRREVEIRSSDGEKMRSLRARKDRSCSICPSCGHGSKTSGGRNIGRELGKKANATARKVREGQKMEDDIGYDSSEESNYDVRLSNRKGRGKTKIMSLSRQEKEEDRHFTEEDEFNIRDSRRKSGNYSRISVANEDFNMDSKSNNVVHLRKVDKDKHFTSIKQHAVVDQQLVEKDNQEFDKRVQKDASWSVSSHRRDEGYNGRPHTIRRESREGFQKVVSDIHEDDTMMISRSKKFADERKVDMA